MHIWYILLAVVIALIPIVFIFNKEKNRGNKYFLLPLICRWLSYSILICLLIVPPFMRVNYKEAPARLIILSDSSSSVQKALTKEQNTYESIIANLKRNLNKDIELVYQYYADGLILDSNANNNVTDISNALQQSLDMYNDESTKGILLLSDGIYNQGMDPAQIARYAPIPIFTLGVGDSNQLMDISIDKVYANKTISAKNIFEVIVDISKYKITHSSIAVQINLNGKVVQSKKLNNDPALSMQQLSFEIKAPEPGIYTYQVTTDIIDGEKNTKNNTKSFSIEVVDEALPILIWQKVPHPDVAAIKKSLAQTAAHKITIHTGQVKPAEIEKYALIILHNIPQSQLASQPDINNKAKWHIVGTQSNIQWFNTYQQKVIGMQQNILNTIFPAYNSSFALFQIPNNTATVTDILPPLSGNYFEGAQVSKSDVLLYQKVGTVATNTPLWFFDLSNGQEAYTLGEGIWRWKIHEFRKNQNTDVMDNLIQQTVNVLAIKNDEKPLTLFIDGTYLTADQPVILQASLKNKAGKLINTIPIQLTLTDTAGKIADLAMQPFGSGYKANLGKLAAGEYNVLAKCTIDQQQIASNISFIVNNISLESLNEVANFKSLHEIAKLSGGSFYAIKDIETLVHQINIDNNFKTVLKKTREQKQLIDYKWIFFILLFLCTFEWIIRKYWNS